MYYNAIWTWTKVTRKYIISWCFAGWIRKPWPMSRSRIQERASSQLPPVLEGLLCWICKSQNFKALCVCPGDFPSHRLKVCRSVWSVQSAAWLLSHHRIGTNSRHTLWVPRVPKNVATECIRTYLMSQGRRDCSSRGSPDFGWNKWLFLFTARFERVSNPSAHYDLWPLTSTRRSPLHNCRLPAIFSVQGTWLLSQ